MVALHGQAEMTGNLNRFIGNEYMLLTLMDLVMFFSSSRLYFHIALLENMMENVSLCIVLKLSVYKLHAMSKL